MVLVPNRANPEDTREMQKAILMFLIQYGVLANVHNYFQY